MSLPSVSLVAVDRCTPNVSTSLGRPTACWLKARCFAGLMFAPRSSSPVTSSIVSPTLGISLVSSSGSSGSC